MIDKVLVFGVGGGPGHRLTRRLSLVLVAALATSCSLAPGIHLKDAEVTERAHEQGDQEFQIQQVTPFLIQKFAKAHAAEVAARPSDPNVAQLKAYEYRIAPLDVLSVVVWDHPELTSPTGQFRSPEENGQPVNADGTMFYPFVGYFEVAGKTVMEVQQELTRRMRHAIKDPQVSVRVASFRGKRVEVTGEVKNPQTVYLNDIPLRVSDALVKGGGFNQVSNPAEVTLIRGGKATVLNLMSYYEEGDLKQNWLLLDGDSIHVGSMTLSQVFVFGEATTMGTRPMFRGRLSLAQALGDSGGFNYTTMRPSVYILREGTPAKAGTTGRPEIYKLDVENADALIMAAQFPLKAKDVVFVATNDLARMNRVISQILPLVNTIWQTWSMVYTTKGQIGF
jgi:polysaccharide export outer membrane protein